MKISDVKELNTAQKVREWANSLSSGEVDIHWLLALHKAKEIDMLSYEDLARVIQDGLIPTCNTDLDVNDEIADLYQRVVFLHHIAETLGFEQLVEEIEDIAGELLWDTI